MLRLESVHMAEMSASSGGEEADSNGGGAGFRDFGSRG